MNERRGPFFPPPSSSPLPLRAGPSKTDSAGRGDLPAAMQRTGPRSSGTSASHTLTVSFTCVADSRSLLSRTLHHVFGGASLL